MSEESTKLPGATNVRRASRGALQVAGGAIPLVGGFLSAVAGAWSERDQEKVNRFFEHWVRMIEDEIREKEKNCRRSYCTARLARRKNQQTT